jgi:hypothetical protein
MRLLHDLHNSVLNPTVLRAAGYRIVEQKSARGDSSP